jgi:DMSO/TMAO reductase YedYZ molybdopterin-dependent catalytic subunit
VLPTSTPRRNRSLFLAGFIAGIAALLFNFILRLEGLAPFPPESALAAFIGIVPASVEEPMVQQFGDLAGQLGLLVATVIAGAVYGLLFMLFDRLVVPRLKSTRLSLFEVLLCFSLIPWLLFGVALFPLTGNSLFGVSGSSPSLGPLAYPATLLLVQGVFALLVLPRFRAVAGAAPPGRPGARPAFRESRRDFVEKSAIGLLAAAAAILGLSSLGSVVNPQVQPSGGSQPVDLQDAPAIFRDPRLSSLVDSEITPSSRFYRVAIDIIDPSVDASSWSLGVDGSVDSQKNYTLDAVKALPSATQYTTLECVSNEINGDLISNAKWKGVKLSDLLADVGGVQTNGKYVVFYSVDGYSVGIPLTKAMEPESILAYEMNDQPLPTGHGYPLRAVIPGLYGMMSAKWINRMSVLDSVYDGYWQTRGWTNDARVNTVAFVVTPITGSQVSISKNGGEIIVAGYAFAGDRGISKVEVSFDEGHTWSQAQLKRPISNLTWALWAYAWTPQKTGQTVIYVRATDGGGSAQTSTPAPTFPNGATGYAFISVDVVQ